MNKRSVLIGMGVIGGLIGLGFLTHFVYGGNNSETDQEENSSPALPEKKKVKQQPNNYNAPIKKQATKKKKMVSIPKVKTSIAENKTITPPTADEFPLRLGSKGKRVERLQIWLMRNYGRTGKITSVFDEMTLKSLLKYLKKSEVDETIYNKMKMGEPVYQQVLRR